MLFSSFPFDALINNYLHYDAVCIFTFVKIKGRMPFHIFDVNVTFRNHDRIIVKSILKLLTAFRAWGSLAGMMIISPCFR
jgi:hypothetical protein